MSLEHGIHYSELVELKVVLAQNRHTFARSLSHRAMCRLELTRENSHQRTFSGTVSTDYTIAIAWSEFEIHILKENSLSKLHTKICNCYHIVNK